MSSGNLHKTLGVASVASEITYIEYADGTKERYRRGLRHHDDLPAIEYPGGAKEWYCDGVFVRAEGPNYGGFVRAEGPDDENVSIQQISGISTGYWTHVPPYDPEAMQGMIESLVEI